MKVEKSRMEMGDNGEGRREEKIQIIMAMGWRLCYSRLRVEKSSFINPVDLIKQRPQ